jgi:mono/diheme cytochrome c family protein
MIINVMLFKFIMRPLLITLLKENKSMPKYLSVTLLCLALLSCSNEDNSSSPYAVDITKKQLITGRWYSQEQLEAGSVVFANHCAECHGQNAEATNDWKTPNADGKYPPPPLNGSAHAWHHPLSVLNSIILKGGGVYGGQMPAFEKTLSQEQIYSAIASFQQYWPDDLYKGWLSMDKESRQ